MKNYNHLSSDLFETNEAEIKKLAPAELDVLKYEDNLQQVRAKYGESVESFFLLKLKSNMKKTVFDNCTLLVFKNNDGRYYAKRHSNSQHLRID